MFTQTQKIASVKRKLSLLLFGGFWFYGLVLLPIWLKSDFDSFQQLKYDPVAISIDPSAIPIFVCIPLILAILWATKKRLVGNYLSTDAALLLKIAVITAPALFLTIFITQWQYSSHLKDKGYQFCKRLTGSTFQAPKIWVRDSSYCIGNAYMVSSDLVDWTEKQARLGDVVTVEQLRNKAHELLESSPFKQ